MRTQCAVPALVLLLLGPGAASAQEPGKVGLVMGYPGAFGLIWHVSDSVAIRPEMTFAWTSSESAAPTSGPGGSNWQLGIGASALFYFARHDSLRPYFSPQWSYSHLGVGTGDSSVTTGGDANTFSGMIGAQYALGDRFAVFGETGAGYTRSSTHFTINSGSFSSSTTRHTDSFGTRGRVGVTWYF